MHSILVDLSVKLGQWPFMGWRQGDRKQEEERRGCPWEGDWVINSNKDVMVQT